MNAHDVFLSYNWRDHTAAEAIARALQQHGLSVFLDRWYLVPGRPWPQALEEALRQCRAVAVILGPSGLGPWQQREKDLALGRQAGDQTFPVIPVLLPGGEPALGFLGLNTWVDLRAGVEDPNRLEVVVAAVRGEPPGPDLQERLQATLAGICPYRGLRYFREEDAPFFFGREEFTKLLVDTVEKRTLVAVVGPSGSGKSSVVRAGLVPQLRRTLAGTVWEIVPVVPGDRPLNALAAALVTLLEPEMTEVDRLEEVSKLGGYLLNGRVSLRDAVSRILEKQPGTDRLLLVIDQWEELYTLCHDEPARERFFEELLGASAAAPLSAVLTLRGDFYGHALNSRAMADRLQGAVVNLGPMTREELELSVKAPAGKVGLTFQPGLVNRILGDVSHEPGNLPLLEFVLESLWQARRGGELIHDVYESMGGAQGALADRAEKEFARLTPLEEVAVRRVFTRLVRPGEGTEDTRRRATVAEVGEAVWPLVQRLAGARLLVTARDEATGGETVEVSHEALIRKWERLQGWIHEDREFLLWRQRLATAMAERRRLPDDMGTLLREARLIEAERWLRKRPQDLTDEERNFISESAAQRDVAQTRRRRIRASLAAAVALAVALMSFAGLQWLHAGEQAQRSLARRLAAQALYYRNSEPDLALLLAAEGVNLEAAPETKSTLLDVLQQHPLVSPSLLLPPTAGRPRSRVTSIAYDRDGASLASVGADGKITVWDVATHSHSESLPVEGQVLSLVAGQGGWRAVSVQDSNISVWDAVTRQKDAVLYGLGEAGTVALSADGAVLAVVDRKGILSLWNVGTGTRRCELHRGQGEIPAIAFNPDGTEVAESFRSGRTVWWDVGAGERRGELQINADVRSLAWGRGGTLAAGIDDGTIALWDFQTRVPLGEPLIGHDASVSAVAFSRDGTRLASGDEDGTIILWDMDLESWKARACRMAARDLTNDERKYYLNGAVPACPQFRQAQAEGGILTQPESGTGAGVPNDMVVVRAGWFWMGCNEKEDETCYGLETRHRVYVDTFAIDKYEVTAAQYQQCVQAGGCEKDLGTDSNCNLARAENDHQTFDDHPINCVNWLQAKRYCEWKNKRLPWEAEWEKAARGDDGSRKYPWGNDEFSKTSKKWANINDGPGMRTDPRIRRIVDEYEDGFPTTAPVRSFPDGISAYGAYDMSGNVYEWVEDKLTGGRGIRGGSCSDDPRTLRSSHRVFFDPKAKNWDIGLRCAR